MKPFIKNILRITFCLLSISSFAQIDSSMQLSLQQAIDLGLTQRFDIKNQELAIQISESNRLKTVSKNLPQVNASVDMRYNAVLATSLLPPNSTTNSTEYTPIKFGTTYNTLTTISATQNIFNANVSGDKLVSQAQKEFDEASLEKYKTDAKSSITQAYYQVLLTREHIRLAEENVKNSEIIFKQGESAFNNGTLIKTDLIRFQLDLSNAKNQLQTAKRNYENSLLSLKNQLMLDPAITLIATDSLESLIETNTASKTDTANIENRYEYKIESSALRLNEIQAKKYNRAYLPSVYLYANASVQNQNEKFTPFNSNSWYPYSFVGIHADIPIFDGLEKKRNSTGYKLKSQQNQNNLQRIRYEVKTETINSRNELQNALEQFESSKENYLLAQEIMLIDQNRYKEGTITFAALKNTETSLQTSQNNYLVNLYNVLVAQVNYKKALGEL